MLAVEVKSIDRINEYNCDILIFQTIFSSNFNNNCYKDLSNIKTNKKIALNVDKIITENELPALKEFLKESLKYNIDYYIFSDLSVYNILNDLGVKNKFIYNAKTLLCSSYDIKSYNELGIICLASTEITLDDVINISNLENNAILVYGYSNIFYSKRKLISLYSNYINKNIKLDDGYIIEETRKEKYKIFENNNGTFIYTPYIYYLFNELNDINKNNIFMINSTFLNEEDLIKVTNIYQDSFNYKFDETNLSRLKEINANLGNGFLYLNPEILKVKNNE